MKGAEWMRKQLLAVVSGAAIAGSITVGGIAGATNGPAVARSYINPDTGMATENKTVNDNSSCEYPDRKDRQRLSDEGETNKNVHNDACIFTRAGKPFDGPVTFKSRGVGTISACPDPDQGTLPVQNGPKVAFTHDHNKDGRIDHCHQSGYQSKDAAGDEEYHIRLNNDSEPGKQIVTFCYDPDQNPTAAQNRQPDRHGCNDEMVKDRIVIRWRR